MGEEIAAALTTEGLEDMSAHFLLCRHSWFQDGRAWRMVRAGREVMSRTDYILGTDCCLFWNVSVRDPRHNSDHYLVLECLHSAPLRENSKFLSRRKRLPLRPPTTPTTEDGLFMVLRRSVLKQKARDARKNRVDLRDHVENRRQESLQAPGPREGQVHYLEVWPRHRLKLERT